jgi:hypothetical protein
MHAFTISYIINTYRHPSFTKATCQSSNLAQAGAEFMENQRERERERDI